MQNGKSNRKADASPVHGNVSQSQDLKRDAQSSLGGEANGHPLDAYKTFDIAQAVRQDVRAAVSLLSLILDNPQILDLVVAEIEKIRAKIIEQESLPKREDFHPELTPSK